VVSNTPGRCVASYEVVFTARNLPNGSATINYTWHLANGSTTPGASTTLNANSSQAFGTRESSKAPTLTGEVYVTWTAGWTSGESNKVSVTITCG
jgi:hypothetical protein